MSTWSDVHYVRNKDGITEKSYQLLSLVIGQISFGQTRILFIESSSEQTEVISNLIDYQIKNLKLFKKCLVCKM